jgi:uncharacterized protein YndB with AHSA1/START domain
MPRSKDFKRLVRARMAKTGEAYTAARAQILSKPRAKREPLASDPIDYAALAGFSDRAVKEKTGCGWGRWVAALDYHGASDMTHREIARLVNQKYKVDGWWSQAVTVGYERIKGLRARGQRLDGSYEAAKSRTFDVPVTTLFDAWANARRRRRWLTGTKVTVRTALAPKSMRFGWSDGSIVAVWFTPKGTSRSAVAVAHTKLRDQASAGALKQYWAERLDALAKTLSA